jgi:hypothetical protein
MIRNQSRQEKRGDDACRRADQSRGTVPVDSDFLGKVGSVEDKPFRHDGSQQ